MRLVLAPVLLSCVYGQNGNVTKTYPIDGPSIENDYKTGVYSLMHDLMEAHINDKHPDSGLSSDKIDTLNGYGCHCLGLFDTAAGGPAKDSIDEVCKQWTVCQSCMTGCTDETFSITVSDTNQGMKDFWCLEDGSCSELLCRCHLRFAKRMVNMLTINTPLPANYLEDASICNQECNAGNCFGEEKNCTDPLLNVNDFHDSTLR